jgi:multiple sugar transport system ATP-binding protein
MQIGTPLEVYNNPKNIFVAGFIGSPAMNFFDVRVVERKGTLCIEGENFKMAVPSSLRDRYLKTKDQEAILGIRPQHIFDKKIRGPFPGGEQLRATIEVVEPVGSEVILLASCGSAQLTAMVDPQTLAKPHAEIEFLVDMNHMHLFNKSTEEVI